MENPYRTPQREVAVDSEDAADVTAVLRGQKEIIYAIAIHMAAMVLMQFEPVLARFLTVIAFGVAVYGLWRIGRGLQYAVWLKVLLVLLMLLPLVNLITLLVVNARATRRLRAAGYKVGLVGAYK